MVDIPLDANGFLKLVAKGFHQQAGFDFNEMFIPVVKPTAISIILTIALANQWKIRQLDFNNAFLNGFLNEEVYMVPPLGFQQGGRMLFGNSKRPSMG